VLDPFVGTGTTCVAAMKAGRNSIGLEVDRDFVKIANDRAQKAILARQQPLLFDVRLNVESP